MGTASEHTNTKEGRVGSDFQSVPPRSFRTGTIVTGVRLRGRTKSADDVCAGRPTSSAKTFARRKMGIFLARGFPIDVNAARPMRALWRDAGGRVMHRHSSTLRRARHVAPGTPKTARPAKTSCFSFSQSGSTMSFSTKEPDTCYKPPAFAHGAMGGARGAMAGTGGRRVCGTKGRAVGRTRVEGERGIKIRADEDAKSERGRMVRTRSTRTSDSKDVRRRSRNFKEGFFFVLHQLVSTNGTGGGGHQFETERETRGPDPFNPETDADSERGGYHNADEDVCYRLDTPRRPLSKGLIRVEEEQSTSSSVPTKATKATTPRSPRRRHS